MSAREAQELQRHYEHLRGTGYCQYEDELGYLHAFLTTTPTFACMLKQLAADVGDFNVEKWAGERIFKTHHGTHR